MDEAGFRHFLKRLGKKEQVVEGLVKQVRLFEAFLVRERQRSLEAAQSQDIQDYAAACEAAEAGSSRVRLRGLGLYYRFAGNAALASTASTLREQGIAATRKSFRLRDFRGARPEDLARLEAGGIVTVDDMLQAGRTPESRKTLAQKTGIPPETILEYVKLSDLSRLGGLKTVRARLYFDAGFDTLDKIAACEAQDLRLAVQGFVERTGFDGIAPLPKEAANTVAGARSLPRIVEYE